MKMFEVGGCVRDRILGLKSKDIDFSVVMDNEENHTTDETFNLMTEALSALGFSIFVANPEFLTVRAQFPREGDTYIAYGGMTADFVLARQDGAYTDGRRPDEVFAGTLEDDLARRDFTMNAIALDPATGEYIDPHDGMQDIHKKIIRCVGSAEARIREDALRALRALRFVITKDFMVDEELLDVLRSDWLPPLLSTVSKERKRDELHKMFHKDTIASMNILYAMKRTFREAIFTDGLWLEPTLKS